MIIEGFCQLFTGGFCGLAVRRTQSMRDTIGVRLFRRVRFGFAFPRLVEVVDAHRGEIMSSGRTTRSNSSSVTKPRPTASSRKVVPFLWAVLATVVALS